MDLYLSLFHFICFRDIAKRHYQIYFHFYLYNVLRICGVLLSSKCCICIHFISCYHCHYHRNQFQLYWPAHVAYYTEHSIIIVTSTVSNRVSIAVTSVSVCVTMVITTEDSSVNILMRANYCVCKTVFVCRGNRSVPCIFCSSIMDCHRLVQYSKVHFRNRRWRNNCSRLGIIAVHHYTWCC